MGMGYACPVCAARQVDGEHLANHVAFTAMLHGEDHETWLDEHVPDWGERDPGELADVVTGRADEVDVDGASDVTVGDRRGPIPESDHHRSEGSGDLDPETRRVIAEAIEMTRERRMSDDREE